MSADEAFAGEWRKSYAADVAAALRGEYVVKSDRVGLYPPCCNTGGTSSNLTGGTTSNLSPKGSKTIVDTVSWSIPSDLENQRQSARDFRPYLLSLFPKGVTFGDRQDGKQGYESQVQILSGSIVLGWLAWGAYHGKMWLYIAGAGLACRREAGMPDADLVCVTRDIDGARLGRLDIALDVFEHAVFKVEDSLRAHASGGYTLPKSPGAPHQELYWSDTSNEAFPIARTHYVGKPNATKRLTVYDKGLQILGRMTPDDVEEYRRKGVIKSDDVPAGRRIEEWTRVELRYHHDKRRPLVPEEMFADLDATFSGAYPILGDLVDRVDGFRPSYLPREEECVKAKLIMSDKESYGGLLWSLRHDDGWTDTQIVEALIGSKRAARIMVDRERPTTGQDD